MIQPAGADMGIIKVEAELLPARREYRRSIYGRHPGWTAWRGRQS